MSNADDRCAYVHQDEDVCGEYRDSHHDGISAAHHAFVEPARKPASSGETAEQLRARLGWPPLTEEQRRGNLEHNLQSLGVTGGERREPAPSGDEAKVRERDGTIADGYSWLNRTPQECLELGRIIEKRAYAAGKADGAREERNECELTVRDSCICQVAECSCSARLRDIARAIARRGGERKEDRGDGAWKPTCAEHTDVDCESECIGRIRCSRECGVGDATSAERHRWGCAKASALRARRGSEGK